MSLRKGLLLPVLALVCALAAPASATAAAPDAELFASQSLDSVTVEVLGRINPGGLQTQYRVQYDVSTSQWCQSDGVTGTPGTQTSLSTLSQMGNTYFAVSIELGPLTGGTAYCARIMATNEDGSDFGSIIRFTAEAPAIKAFSGEATGHSSGRVGGAVNPVGKPTQYWARYAPADSTWCQSGGDNGSPLDVTTPQSLPETDNADHGVTVDLNGLMPQTEYCADLVASNSAGSGHSDQVSLTTDEPPVQLCAATWNGGTGAWTDANWTFEAPSVDGNADGAPDVDDSVCIPSGVVTLSSPQTVAGLRVTGGGRLDVTSALSVDDPTAAPLNDGDVTVASGATLQLTSTAAAGSSLTGGRLTIGGTVRTLAGAGGARSLSFATIANGGGATLETNTATSFAALTFTNAGTIAANGSMATGQQATLTTAGHQFQQNAGAIVGSGALVLGSGSYHHNGGTVFGAVVQASGEGLDLDGTGIGTVNVIKGTSTLTADIAALKTVNVRGGVDGLDASLSVGDDRTNAGSIVLTNNASGDGGNAFVDPGASTLTNTGTFRTQAVGSGAGSRGYSDVGPLVNTGTGELDLDYSIGFDGPVTSAGTVDVPSGVTATMDEHDFKQTAGTTVLGGQINVSASKLDLQGGTLEGGGHVAGPLQNAGGTVSPAGDIPGQLTVAGQYTQGQNGKLRIDVDGTTPVSGHDRLAVSSGSAALGGTLVVDMGFTPALSDQFTFVTSTGALSGTFASQTGGAVTGGSYGPVYTVSPGSVKLVRKHTLSVTKPGSGSGSVASAPSGVDCGSDCAEDYVDGAVVTLTATPLAGSRFGGWSGSGCSGTGTCQVTMSAARSVTATFVQQRTLTVTRTGSGGGSVSSNVAGIACGVDCSEAYDEGTVVTLTATPVAGSRFVGWSGEGCSGTSTCQVTLSAARNVSANFAAQRALTVTRAGTGAGSVSGTGVTCGIDCDETFDQDTVVTLTATASAGSRFGGWSGSGTEACTVAVCQVTMSQARSVTATFVAQRGLTVSKAGNGGGSVSGSGIDCGGDCSQEYDEGASVTLTASPAAGSRFTGWSGDCSGAGACQVTLSAARSVTASFATIDDDGDGVSPPADCNDGNASVRPGGNDVPGNGVDEDCSGGDAAVPPPLDIDEDGVPDAVDPDPVDPDVPGPFGATNEDDALDATGIGERICGLLGNDVIRGLGGNDTIFGDLCDVKAKLVAAQAGAGGNDTISGGAGNDVIYGAGGADKVTGDDGNDKLYGGGGNDALNGGKGKDALDGGAGNDKLTGGPDVNTYKGGAGDDKIEAKNKKKETVDCGSGKKDYASVDKADKVKGCEKLKRAKK